MKPIHARVVIWTAGASLFPAGPLTGQAVEERSLGEPEVAFPEPFGSIAGLRELPDGRVLVADGLGQALVVADIAHGTADTIGSVGQGPDEYRQPDGLFPLPGDSTLLADLGNGRLTVLGPNLGFGPTEPIAREEQGRSVFVLPRGTDRQGRVYFQRMGGLGGAGRALRDSAAIMRWDRARDRLEEVGRVKLQDRTRSTSGGPNDRSVMIRALPYSPEDAWGVGSDGRVALARTADYHLEWIAPDGRLSRGPAVEYRPVPVRDADKQEWLDALSGGLRVMVTVENGMRQTSFSRGGGGPGRQDPDPDDYEWPRTKPPFAGTGVAVAPDGVAWVRRHVSAGEPVVYDVFDHTGQLIGHVRLPTARRLVAFGADGVYLLRRDELDFEWLERYRMPTF